MKDSADRGELVGPSHKGDPTNCAESVPDKRQALKPVVTVQTTESFCPKLRLSWHVTQFGDFRHDTPALNPGRVMIL